MAAISAGDRKRLFVDAHFVHSTPEEIVRNPAHVARPINPIALRLGHKHPKIRFSHGNIGARVISKFAAPVFVL